MNMLVEQIAKNSKLKEHLTNVLGVICITAISLIPMVYVMESMSIPIKGTPAPINIQSLSNGITDQLGIKPIKIEIYQTENMAGAYCPLGDSECRIIINGEIARRVSDQTPAIAGILAHEIGHIVEPQTSKFIKLLPEFLTVSFVLLMYVYLTGWKYALLVFSTLSIMIFFVGVYGEKPFGSMVALLIIQIFLSVLGAFVWPVQLKSMLKILVTMIFIGVLTNQITKYLFRHDEANADIFSLKVVGKTAATQMLCFAQEDMKKNNSSPAERIYIEWIDVHPSIEDRFAFIKASSTDCL